jgi:hypothetical protein
VASSWLIRKPSSLDEARSRHRRRGVSVRSLCALAKRSFSLDSPIVRSGLRALPSASYLPTNIILILSAIAHTLLDHLESSQIRSAAQRARPFACHYHIHTRVRYEVASRSSGRIAIAEQEEEKNKSGGRSIRYYSTIRYVFESAESDRAMIAHVSLCE